MTTVRVINGTYVEGKTESGSQRIRTSGGNARITATQTSSSNRTTTTVRKQTPSKSRVVQRAAGVSVVRVEVGPRRRIRPTEARVVTGPRRRELVLD